MSTHRYNLRPTPKRRAAAMAAELEADRPVVTQIRAYLTMFETAEYHTKIEVTKAFFKYLCDQPAFFRRHQSFRQTTWSMCDRFKKGPTRYAATRLMRVLEACGPLSTAESHEMRRTLRGSDPSLRRTL